MGGPWRISRELALEPTPAHTGNLDNARAVENHRGFRSAHTVGEEDERFGSHVVGHEKQLSHHVGTRVRRSYDAEAACARREFNHPVVRAV